MLIAFCSAGSSLLSGLIEKSCLLQEIGQGTVGYRIRPRAFGLPELSLSILQHADTLGANPSTACASGDTINGKLCFVTVGYLLQRLVNNPEDRAWIPSPVESFGRCDTLPGFSALHACGLR